MKYARVQVAQIVSQGFEENTFVARLEDRNDCIVIDPGLEPEKIIDYLSTHNLTPAAILITHGHGDHIGGNAALRQKWPDCRIIIGEADAEKLLDPNSNLSAPFGLQVVSPAADVLVNDGDLLCEAGIDVEVRAIPGHSAGHVVYVCPKHEPILVFVGDVIFSGSVGRTDFFDGDFEQLETGIRSKLYTLPDDAALLPGHGPATTVGREKRTNPFVRP